MALAARKQILSLSATLGFLLAAAAATSAQAQHPHPQSYAAAPVDSSANAAQGAFAVRTYSAFRDMMNGRDYRPKVDLGAAKADGATDAVGALSALRGEIAMLDGRFVVSYGAGCDACSPAHGEKATLLVTGKVAQWAEPAVLPDAFAGKALEHFIIEQAKAAGLDLSKPFPVRLKGTLTDVAMHVLKAPNAKFSGHGSAHSMAEQDDIKAASISGNVIGFFAPSAQSGLMLHPGAPFHFHWVNEARNKTAHIDSFGMTKGALLFLPGR